MCYVLVPALCQQKLGNFGCLADSLRSVLSVQTSMMSALFTLGGAFCYY